MKRLNEIKKQNVEVEFYDVEAGWLQFSIRIGDNSFEDSFSHVFDPVIDLKHWLESLSIGVQQSSLTYDPEGELIRINFDISNDGTFISSNDDEGVFTILEHCENGIVFINSIVDRKQLVKAFYLGLLNFISSDKYKKEEWEYELFRERMCDLSKLSDEELIDEVVEMDRKELIEVLYKLDPVDEVVFPMAKNEKESFKLFIDYVINEKMPETEFTFSIPDYWEIPDDYDYWTKEKKLQFIENCLNEPVHGYSANKIVKFKSKIIEKYLLEDETE